MATSVTKRGKVWSYRVYYTENKKRKYVSKSGFKTKREAQDAAILRESELINGKKFGKEKTLLADYMKYWKELYKDDVISYGSSAKIDTIISYIRKKYNVQLIDVTLDNYQAYLNELAETRTKSTVKKYHAYTRAAITHAVHSQILLQNPTDGAIVKGNASKEKRIEDKYLSIEQFKQLESVLLDGLRPDYTSRYVILFSMYTGARFGECLAMTWDCVDFANGFIKINKGFDYLYTNQFTEGKTKNATRRIVVSQKLLDLLETLSKNNDRIFSRISNNAVNNVLQKSLHKIGIEDNITFHAIRHTHASILLSQGVQLLSVSKRLGHADPSITLNTYAHIIDELESADNDKIRSIF